ncbi:MAG: DUF1343 domain-containing protein [Spartobacteria bacterium]|nr:DUF1343 domain-containing protein [Spartobacteria bacterium]
MTPCAFKPGISTLTTAHRDWIAGKRVGLLAHSASRDEHGSASWQRLQQAGIPVACLFSPEHGFDSLAGAGERVDHAVEACSGLPVYSLYGDTRKPAPEWFAPLDVIICDLQDLGVRCYTYVSTLRYILETAAETGKEVIVADRPAPMPATLDGPMLDPSVSSFVGMIPAPLCYGMTPGETALFLRDMLGLDLDLRVARMAGYPRDGAWPDGMPWVRPSPGIRTWQTARVYPATVCCEALPALHYGQQTDEIFQCIGAPWLDAESVAGVLARADIPGAAFSPRTRTVDGVPIHYVDIRVSDPARFRPVASGIHLLAAIRDAHGNERIWGAPGTREAFFDQLLGTPGVRKGLQAQWSARAIIDPWQAGLAAFDEIRGKYLLYRCLTSC